MNLENSKGSHPKYIVALDQGTTSSRAIVFDLKGREVSRASMSLAVRFPEDAWVEQDANEVWESQRSALLKATEGIAHSEIEAIGITNQRETTIVWDRETGKPLAPAIVWQCRRSSKICQDLKEAGHAQTIHSKTGLVVDPYFSATKIRWMLENVGGLKEKLDKSQVVFGTVDSWILANLSNFSVIGTEPSNACRTMLYSLQSADWDDGLLEIFSLKRDAVPALYPSVGKFADIALDNSGVKIPVTAMLGDQQASLLGHGCIEPNMAKCTFGTGAFLLMNVGQRPAKSDDGLLSSVAWSSRSLSNHDTFALEGSIFVAGSLIQWLRDGLGLVETAAASEEMAAAVETSAGVTVIPAFTGLGAPHWNDKVRGAIFGLTRESNANHIVRAALEGIAHQVADVLELPEFSSLGELNIDGGMAQNSVFCQILADTINRPVLRSSMTERTAFGVARAAAVGAGIYSSLEEASRCFAPEENSAKFKPVLPQASRLTARDRWKNAMSSLVGTGD